MVHIILNLECPGQHIRTLMGKIWTSAKISTRGRNLAESKSQNRPNIQVFLLKPPPTHFMTHFQWRFKSTTLIGNSPISAAASIF